MAEAGSKKNPYGVDSDPMRGRTNPLQSPPSQDPAGALKRKQKASIEDEMNKPDPVGDFVRRIIGGNKERKKNGY
jgi:hypothetical protein